MIEECIADVRSWYIGNRLIINDAKTDFLIIGTRQQLEKTSIESFIIGDTLIKPLESVRNLGSWFHANMQMNVHIGMLKPRYRSINRFMSISRKTANNAEKTSFVYGITIKPVMKIRRSRHVTVSFWSW